MARHERTDLTVGVLGGMGPAATIDFMSKVIALTPAQSDQDHIHMIVDHNPRVPDRQKAVLEGGPGPGAELGAMAERLERAGADFLVMVCNSAHAFLEPARARTTIPFISIIDASIHEVRALPSPAARVGVLATDGLLAAGMYQRALEECGCEAVVPRGEALRRIMALIHMIKAGEATSAVAREMEARAEELAAAGAEVIIAGCTEIPLVLDAARVGVPVIASTDALARRTIALARGLEPLPEISRRQ